MTPRDTARGVGKDRTDWRRHRTTAIGGKITRSHVGMDPGYIVGDGGIHLVETSIVRCCDEVKPGKMCPHGVWGFTKVESP